MTITNGTDKDLRGIMPMKFHSITVGALPIYGNITYMLATHITLKNNTRGRLTLNDKQTNNVSAPGENTVPLL